MGMDFVDVELADNIRIAFETFELGDMDIAVGILNEKEEAWFKPLRRQRHFQAQATAVFKLREMLSIDGILPPGSWLVRIPLHAVSRHLHTPGVKNLEVSR
jgi:hypothetical protein